MRSFLIWFGALLALGILNWAIYQKEQLRSDGETVYLSLAPVDPRSLMQGDYMVINYSLTEAIRREELPALGGQVVIKLDENRVGHFVRLADNQPLAPDERLLRYRNRRGPYFGIESFFFQEGRADEYNESRFAELKISPTGTAMLIDLHDHVPPPAE